MQISISQQALSWKEFYSDNDYTMVWKLEFVSTKINESNRTNF